MPKDLNYETDPTLPRYGTDLIQKGILTLEAELPAALNEASRFFGL